MSSILLKHPLLPRAIWFSSRTLTPSTPEDTAVSTAVSILTNHRSKTRWSTLKSLFPQGLTHPQISQILLKIRNNPHLAFNFFNFTTHHFHSKPTSLHSYATIIHVLARARQKTRAQTLIRDAVRVWNGQSFELFKLLVETYRVCDSAPFVFDLLIKSLLEMNKLDPCLEIVRMLYSGGYHVKVCTCNALISVASKRKGCFFGYDLYKEMFGNGGSCGVLPNVCTFNELMLSFRRNGVLDMVEDVWVEMRKSGCSANCCGYSILMEAYCEDGDIKKARGAWEELKLEGLEPDVVAYNVLIGGYCKIGEVEKGEEFYREMVSSGVEGNSVTYKHLVNGYCLVGDSESAMLLCEDMRRKGFCPDSYTVNAVVNVLCDKNCVVEALGFFKIVMDDADFVARETSYERLIKGLCGVEKMDEALKLQAQMVGKGFRPNAVIYDAFIVGYMKQGKTDVAENLRKEFLGM